MFLRALTIALWCASASALTPLSAAGDDNECALYLTGPGRTSAYDYSLNLLKGNFGYEGQHTCITYDAVNQAYLEARNRILVSQPKGDWKAEDFASVGELILDISINLARTYGLTYEEIEKGLPLIDTSRTLIREVCPPVFSHVECRAGKYRRLDGLCNNLKHPTWGATMAPFQRLIGPLFADGINAPRISHTGRDLPLSRVVSRTMHPDEGFHDHAGTVMVIAWGQFMDHDYTLTGTPLDPINRNDPEECCKRPPHLKHPYCNEIRVPEDDYFYRLFGVKCIDFVRGFPSPRPGCRLGSRVPFNTLTGVIDGNTVYGVTDKFARKLRTGYGGLLRMNPVFKEYGLRDLLPLKLDIPDEGCTRPNKNMYCFEAGEIRVNEQLVLTVMHTLMAREHNRVAKGLAEVNPHWDDETLYQEARRINIAEIQHITYNEFLPILLGKDVMEKFGLVLEKEGYWDGYDQDVNPDVIDSFAAAAYRFGHSLLPTAVERWSKAHKFIASKRLSDLIRRPYDLYRAGVLDEYVMGLMNQVAQAMDDSITQEVTNHLFKKVGARFGMDLVSFNMQRGREFGLPGYMEFRKFCGLSGADNFQDLFGTMSNETVRKYETIFEHPIDVDLWSGGVSERPLPGSMLGPTFACVIATQFSYSRRGDRFWYELPNQPSTFTPEQLTEIRKARLARVICDNTDIIDTVQLYPMVLPDHELNPRVPCRSGIIPSIDFSKWAEPAPFHGAAKQFMTDAFIPNSNGAGCSNDSITTSDKNNITETLEYKPNSVQNDNNCNITTNFDPPQKGNLITVENSNITLNNTSNTPTNTTHDCDENSTSEECLNQLTQINEISKSDTVLKYVYQKDDKSFIKEKPKGHQLNSIQRRKRSINTSNQIENITAEASVKAPLIVNYETSHTPGDDSELPTHQRITENTIKNSALADFNIQTLHEPIKSSKNDDHKENSSSQSEEDDTESSEKLNYKKSNSYESSESDYLKNKQNLKKQDKTSESEESIEKEDDRTNKSGSSSVEDSREVNDVNRDAPQKRKGPFENYESNPQKPLDSTENSEYKKYRTRNTIRDRETLPITKHRNDNESNEEDSSKSLENSDSIESNESTSQDTDNEYSRKDRKHESQELIKKENFRDDESSQEQQSHEDSGRSKAYKNQDDSRQSNSYENNDNDDDNQRQTNKHIQNSEEDSNNSEINSSTPRTLQDVDLGDFSYERVQVDEKGKIVTAKDHDDNQSQIPIKPLVILDLDRNQFSEPLKKDENDINRGLYGVNNPIKLNDDEVKPVTPGLDQNQFSGSFKDKDDINHEIYDFNNPAKINDDEVKPVIEINSEHKENESDEDNSKEALKVNPDEDESLETILGVNKNDAEEQNEEIAKEKETVEKADVKQQFERIPLNYKHENEKDQSDKDVHADTKEIHQEKIDVPSPNDEGKKDTFSPKDVNYDDKLKFKFDDISIKLPEIKLPEDILSYAYEEPSYGKKKDKQQKSTPKPKYYQYSDENSDDGPHDDNDDNDHDYYGHSHDDKQHGTNEQQTKEADDHDHDYYGHRHAKPKQNLKKKGDDEEDDEYVDLYEKFVRERFGKRGSFEKRSEKLEDANLPYNPKLYENVQKILKKAALIDKQAKTSGDPKAGYAWTLEYGENLK